MQTCKHCGADISHLRKGTKFCKKEDNAKCFRERSAASALERVHRRAKERGRYCSCGNLIITPNGRYCSPACRAKNEPDGKIVNEQLERKKRRMMKEIDTFGVEWMYDMKMFDRDVNPADVCPMG